MGNQEIIKLLKEKIYNNLAPIIGEKCILTDLPYHYNIGDLLIWAGELQFLKENRIRCYDSSDYHTFSFPKIDDNVTILMHGGGNFGDLYEEHQTLRKEIIKNYPENKIIMFPQSVWYENKERLLEDIEIFSNHKNLILCARDKYSFDFLSKYFTTNKVLLVPDMAFYIDKNIIEKQKDPIKKDFIFIKRRDKELKLDNSYEDLKNTEDRDWITFEKNNIYTFILRFIIYLQNSLKRSYVLSFLLNKILNTYCDKIFRNKIINMGIKQLSQFELIITTRLHAMILSILLDRKVKYIDNLSGKLSAFANTWLNDVESLRPV